MRTDQLQPSGRVKLPRESSVDVRDMKGWGRFLGFLCFGALPFFTPWAGRAEGPAPRRQLPQSSSNSAPAPSLLPIPQPTPSTDAAVKQQVEDAWAEFQAVAGKRGVSPEDLA